MHVCQPKINGRRLRGFTLIELLVTLSVAAIFLAIAIPSYRATINRNSIAAQVNHLLADLNYARSESITRGNPVRVCKTDNDKTCTTNSVGWQQGWLVYNDLDDDRLPAATDILRVHQGMATNITIAGNRNVANQVRFDSNGFALGNFGTLTFCDADDGNATNLVISASGRVRSEHVSDASCSP